jgi:copper transport protein
MIKYTWCSNIYRLSVKVKDLKSEPNKNAGLTVFIFSICLLFVFGMTQATYGHAFLTSSNPPPSQSLPSSPINVETFFSEPVDLRYSQIKIFDEAGSEVDNKDTHYVGSDQAALAVTLRPLDDGVYTVSTNVLSQIDGHVTKNAFVFGVGESPITSNISTINPQSSIIYVPEAIARFPTLIGQVIIVGGAFSILWLWRPITKIQWFSDLFGHTRNNIDKRLISLFVMGSVILVVSDFVIIVIQAFAISASVLDVITTRFGMVMVARIILSLTLLSVSVYEYQRFRVSKRILSKGDAIGILALGIFLLLTTSLIGHGAAKNEMSSIAIDFAHNIAASLWIGGIVYLALVLVPKLKSDSTVDEHAKNALLTLLIPRFSTSVIVLLGLIVFTGPFLLYILENDTSLLVQSLYGKTLIVKLVLASIMLIVGAYNQLVIYRKAINSVSMSATPVEPIENSEKRMNQGFVDTNKDNKSEMNYDTISRFYRSIRIECIVGIMLIAAVAFLVNTGLPQSEFQDQSLQQKQPGSSPSSQSAFTTFQSIRFIDNDTRVLLSVSPYSVGSNNFTISFTDSKGNPIDVISAVMKFTETGNSIGPIYFDLEQVSKGAYFANATFGIPGLWNIQIQGTPNKINSPNIVTTFNNLVVKPKLDRMEFSVTKFNVPGNSSQPLYPIYDRNRNAIWVGDTAIETGRILEFRIDSNIYVEHKLNGTSIITVSAQDSKDRIWFVDPLTRHLGTYDPTSGVNRLYQLPANVIPSSIAIDQDDKIWLTAPTTNAILEFDPIKGNFTSVLHLQGENASPIAVAVDVLSGLIWITDDRGKLAMIDPAKNYELTEYSPIGINNTLKSPTALLIDDITGIIYISQHEGNKVSSFNKLTHVFDDYQPLDPMGLPFGMTLDKYRNLWVAEHTINKIAVIDPQTDVSREVELSSRSPFVQWLTSDSEGNVWFAEQRGNALGVIKSTPLQDELERKNMLQENGIEKTSIKTKLSYSQIIGPVIAIGLIVIALMYVKSITDFESSVALLKKARKSR